MFFLRHHFVFVPHSEVSFIHLKSRHHLFSSPLLFVFSFVSHHQPLFPPLLPHEPVSQRVQSRVLIASLHHSDFISFVFFSFRSFLRASLDLSLRQRVLHIPLRIGGPFKGEQSLAALGFALRLRRIRISKPRGHQANRSDRTEPSGRATGNAQAIQSRIDSDVQRAITRRRSAQSLENRLSGDESIRRHAVFRIDSPVSHRIRSIQ